MSPTRTHRFWMVYVEDQRGPGVTHDTQEAAEKEAGRLAIKTGTPAYVLESQSVHYLPPPIVTKARLDYAPTFEPSDKQREE